MLNSRPINYFWLLCVLFWLPQISLAVDVVSSASRTNPLPPPDDDGTTTTLLIGAAQIHLLIEGRPFELAPKVLQNWVQGSAEIVAQYYGGFPVAESWVAIRGARGTGVKNGRALGTPAGGTVNVDVGLLATPEDLANDWILIHELIHLAFPNVPRPHHWLEEGLSVYVESIARASAGELSTDQVWADCLDGMPKGLPRAGDKGLDHTPTWGRTYWGGALFCLLADIRVREQSNGEKDLRDALRSIAVMNSNFCHQDCGRLPRNSPAHQKSGRACINATGYPVAAIDHCITRLSRARPMQGQPPIERSRTQLCRPHTHAK